MKSTCFTIWTAGILLAMHPSCRGAAAIEELSRLDRLAAFKTSVKVGMVSSYDRTGGNDDGFSGKYSMVRKEADAVVIADLQGPGIIYRVWTPTPTDDMMEFWFDGEARPRVEIKFRDLFLGRHPASPRPLVGFGAGGYYCYVPLPFAKSCVVRVRAPKIQFYQINYALYGPDSPVSTFDPQLSDEGRSRLEKACRLFGRAGEDISDATAPTGARIECSRSAVVLEPNSSKTVFQADKGGRIVGLRVSPVEAVAGKARDVLLKISFDGDSPAVFCPLGDFFGYAWGQPAMQSLLAGTRGETNYCYFPMPFDRRAVVEIVSERTRRTDLQVEVLHTGIPRGPDEGRFYAVWGRENPTQLGQPYTFLDTEGRGHLVGVVLQSQGFESGKTLFFEGDDQTTLDGELVIHGTGSEDFFNGGWYDVPDRWEKRISFPLSGCLGYAKHLGRTGAYRFFLGDAYAYRRSIRQTIEHAGEKNSIPTDYCSVTYFYSDRKPSANPEPPPLSKRAVTDLDEIIFPAWWQLPIYAWSFDRASLTRKMERLGNEEVRYLSLTATGQDWFGSHFLSPVCDVPTAGQYSVYLEVLKGPSQAKVQLFQNENPVAEAVDFYAEQPAKSGRVLMGGLFLNEGRNNLMFKLVGQHEKSTGLGLDLIHVICVRKP
ncbi:MAG TPA: DUF2961 domain-containing protein [Verrucomicrobiota bacterium]|nr:DUF2961 domain-containing protein [Verrucomicrobiota bacterium]